jgi:oligopeptide transport system ATP-binding protein
MSEPLLKVEDLSVAFRQAGHETLAVDRVSFDIKPRETLALVGESGSGKSVTALSVLKLLPYPSASHPSGRVLFKGRDLLAMPEDKIREVRGNDITMVFQEPMTSLNPLHTIERQIAEVLAIHHGLSGHAATKRVVELLSEVGIHDPQSRLASYPHQLSGGQRQRVMIALALANEPELFIADEPTTALDVTVQAQMLDLFAELTDDFGTSLVLITHDLGVVAGVADRMMVMYAGRAVEVGTVDELFYDPRHPYTFGLLHSTTHVEKTGDRLAPIKGLPPSLEHLPSGCAFNPRCAFKMDRCEVERPELVRREHNRLSACFYEGEMERRALEEALT